MWPARNNRTPPAPAGAAETATRRRPGRRRTGGRVPTTRPSPLPEAPGSPRARPPRRRAVRPQGPAVAAAARPGPGNPRAPRRRQGGTKRERTPASRPEAGAPRPPRRRRTSRAVPLEGRGARRGAAESSVAGRRARLKRLPSARTTPLPTSATPAKTAPAGERPRRAREEVGGGRDQREVQSDLEVDGRHDGHQNRENRRGIQREVVDVSEEQLSPVQKWIPQRKTAGTEEIDKPLSLGKRPEVQVPEEIGAPQHQRKTASPKVPAPASQNERSLRRERIDGEDVDAESEVPARAESSRILRAILRSGGKGSFGYS